jgi:hypothetical protein
MTIDEIIDKLKLTPVSRIEWYNPISNTTFNSIRSEYAGVRLWFHLQEREAHHPDLWVNLLSPSTMLKEKNYLWRKSLIDDSVYTILNIRDIKNISIDEQVLLSNVIASLFL